MQFIVIEGLDGSGKTTVTKLLAERFAAQHLPCYRTYEPTNNSIGTLIRSILAGQNEPVSNETMALLFAADRCEHIWNEIIPNKVNNYVVCDRYYLSNMAYQSSDDENLEDVVYYNQLAITNCRPDITFFINVTPDECMRRIEKRGDDKSIFETLPALEFRYKRYMAAIERMRKTDNIIIVGSDITTPEEIVQQMWEHIYKKSNSSYHME